jgi:hypothetical protein
VPLPAGAKEEQRVRPGRALCCTGCVCPPSIHHLGLPEGIVVERMAARADRRIETALHLASTRQHYGTIEG